MSANTSFEPSSSYPPQSAALEAFFASSQLNSESDLRNQSHRLVAKALAFFKELPPLQPVKCILKHTIPADLLKEVYQINNFSGLCIGESHTHTAPKQFLIENMPQLKVMGVTTLFLELIKSGSMQKELDQWVENDNQELAPQTAYFLKKLDKKYRLVAPYSYAGLIQCAKKEKIRIVAIDSPVSAVAGCHPDLPLDLEKRILGLNYTAKQIMNKEIGQGKAVILTGADHGSTLKNSNVPGLSELMQWPFIIISDASKYKPPGAHLKPSSPSDLRYKNSDGSVHGIFVISKPTSPNDSPRRSTM